MRGRECDAGARWWAYTVGVPAARLFYRIAKTDPPTVVDFLSNKALGRRRRRNESEDEWAGLSLYDTEEGARVTARRYPQIGSFLAVVRVTEGTPFRIAQTFHAGHYTLWGEPEDFLRAVIAVVPIE